MSDRILAELAGTCSAEVERILRQSITRVEASLDGSPLLPAAATLAVASIAPAIGALRSLLGRIVERDVSVLEALLFVSAASDGTPIGDAIMRAVQQAQSLQAAPGRPSGTPLN